MAKRNEKIDFYKALLMFSVIWGHTINIMLNGDQCDCNISWFLRSFDMPMFMLLSGYFLKYSIQKYSLKNLLVNKTTYILFPAVFWSLLVSMGHKIYTMYFLWAVYLSSIIMIVVEQWSNKTLKFIIYTVLIVMLHIVHADFVNMSYLFPFFVAGYYVKSLDNNYPIMILFFILLICFWNTDYNIWSSGSYVLDNPSFMSKAVFLRFAIGLAGIFAMKCLFDMVYSYISPRLGQKKIWEFIMSVGRETLALYILQAIATYGVLKIVMQFIISQFGYNPLLINERLLIYIICPIIALVIINVSMQIIKLFRKNRYFEKLFGFKLYI